MNRYFENIVIVGVTVLVFAVAWISGQLGLQMARSDKLDAKMFCEAQVEHLRMQRRPISMEQCMREYEELMPVQK